MIFWHNLFQYPRFFISSMIGLILIIVNPVLNIIKKNVKNSQFLIFIIIFAFLFLTMMSWILGQMLSLD